LHVTALLFYSRTQSSSLSRGEDALLLWERALQFLEDLVVYS
jgi:hypothetical protein